MLIFRIFWWSWWVMFWGIVLFLLFGCTTKNWETNLMQEASASCPEGLDRLEAQIGRGFKLACERR